MKILYIDPSSGISGDMTIAAMLDLGLPFDYLKENLEKLELSGYENEVRETVRYGFRAKQFIVRENEDEYNEGNNKKKSSKHHHQSRDLKDLVSLVEQSPLPSTIKNKAVGMFEILAEAESKVHGVEDDEIHLHEVGAIDSIVDIVGACIAFDYFKPDKVVCGEINLGGGSVETAHGRLPVPPPAVAELVKGMPVYSSGQNVELTTPTGALILKTFVNEFSPFPQMRVNGLGCGAGTREIEGSANILRIFEGEALHQQLGLKETVTVLETEMDDMQPENLGFLMERLFNLPVLDAYFTPVQMKKNRPGVLLTVLSNPEKATEALNIILMETSTLGVRKYEAERYILERKSVEVETLYGRIRMKIGLLGSRALKARPEFEDCRAAALKHGVPLRDVQEEAMKKYQEQEKKR